MTTLAARQTERRWWIAAVTWTGALYLGTAIAQQLMLILRDGGYLGATITTIFSVAAVAALVLVLRAGGRGRALAVAAAFALLYLAIVVRLPVLQERLHFIQFGVLALLAERALTSRRQRLGPGSWWRRRSDLAGIAIGTAGGLGDELVQAVVPSRVFDWRDVGFNAAAALLAVAALRSLTKAVEADRAGRSGDDGPTS